MASAIVGIMVLKAMGRSVMNKPTWKGGIISGLLGLLPFYLLLCLFGHSQPVGSAPCGLSRAFG